VDAVEIDELCLWIGSKQQRYWLWLAVSRYTGQILSAVVGARSFASLQRLWNRLPARYRRRLIYTDGYEAYAQFFAPWQHRPCIQGDGGTCTVEGVNNAMRQRGANLVRKTCSLARKAEYLWDRLQILFHAHNEGCRKRWESRQTTTRLEP
jgi:insertion element IS1 protein InsB